MGLLTAVRRCRLQRPPRLQNVIYGAAYHGLAGADTTLPASSIPRYRIDVRSDTMTRPSQDMYKAMFEAPVGDDVFCEDPSVRELELHMCDITGKEAALFCSTATMANQLAAVCHLGKLESVVLDGRNHMMISETGGLGFHSRTLPNPIRVKEPLGQSVHVTVQDIEEHLIPPDVHYVSTSLVCVENTLHGSVLPWENLKNISKLCKDRGLKLHMDGARLWNASAKTGKSLQEYCDQVTSTSLCFSKGMGAPMGAILVGPRDFIDMARHYRKLFGGGMRQIGIMAAACKHAVNHHFPNDMHADHEKAALLGKAFDDRGIGLERPVETNMVWLNTKVANEPKIEDLSVLSDHFAKEGIAFAATDRETARLVMHRDISLDGVHDFVACLDRFLTSHSDTKNFAAK
eukprot:Clim_evm6s44 gene=Clim_evmTU6s44